jgi:hypothetical protein
VNVFQRSNAVHGAILWSTLIVTMLIASPCLATDDAAGSLTEEEKKKADELDRITALANKETAAITAQSQLAKAKVAAATPAVAENVTAPTGAVTGANTMSFAMYMVSLESLRHIAQAVCNDLDQLGIKEVYTTSKDVSEAVAKDAALSRARDQLVDKLNAATAEARRMKASVSGDMTQPKITAASLTAVASGIDIAAGLVKGASGLASLFKSERKIEASDNLLNGAEVSASLSMCGRLADNGTGQQDKAAFAPRIRSVDSDLGKLVNATGAISNEIKIISDHAASLETELGGLKAAAEALARDRVAAEAAKDKKKMASLEERKVPNYDTFIQKANALVTTAQGYVDAIYQVDAATGLSPLIVAAQFRVVKEAAMPAPDKSGARLVLTLLKSNGYSLTTKRLLLSDRVDYAGGVAVRAAILDAAGTSVYDRMFFRESGWIRADFHSTGIPVQRQNF